MMIFLSSKTAGKRDHKPAPKVWGALVMLLYDAHMLILITNFFTAFTFVPNLHCSSNFMFEVQNPLTNELLFLENSQSRDGTAQKTPVKTGILRRKVKKFPQGRSASQRSAETTQRVKFPSFIFLQIPD